MEQQPEFLKVIGIHKSTAHGAALIQIDLTQSKGHRIAIAGATGSGKTTLLKIIAGLVQPDSGHIYFEGKKVIGPEDQLMPGHRGIAYLSQQFELPSYYTVENILNYENRLSASKAQELYTLCRINDLLHRKTNELSGGEKQRIAMARVLISKLQLLLLDEPFSNLDLQHKRIIKEVITDIEANLKVSFILVSHEPMDILPWADTILIMQEGQILQQGKPATVYHHPINEYAAGLLGSYNLIKTELATYLQMQHRQPIIDKTMLIRPEHILIRNKETDLPTGIVSRSFFYGSHYEMEVQTNQTLLRIKTPKMDFGIGQIVSLQIPSEHIIYI